MTDSPRSPAVARTPAADAAASHRRSSGSRPAALAALSVLAHPIRLRIAERLGGAPDGLTVADLTAALDDVQHNAIRNHLRTMGRAGLIAVERDPPSGRGRPTERYRLVDPEASRIAARHELVRLLVALLVDVGADDDRARAFGAAEGSSLVAAADRDEIVGSLARLGFAPHDLTSTKDAAAGVLEVRLDFCPFADAVLTPGGTIVCALHRGLIEGAAGMDGAQVQVTEFTIRDPREAGCRVRLQGLPPDQRRRAT
jgi:predicted ArsR family transcriptional regulator